MTDLGLLYDLSPAQWDVVESLDGSPGREIIPFFLKANASTLQEEVRANHTPGYTRRSQKNSQPITAPLRSSSVA